MDMTPDARPMQEWTAPAQGIGTAILCAFFVSGVCGLLHQIVWTRLLRHVMGNDTFAITTVLCAFMGGLALGSYAGGRLIDRRRDALRVFAILEGAIALYCLLLPALIDLTDLTHLTEPIYVHIYRSTEASFYTFSLLLLLPATMMGATLPILTRFLVRSPDRVGCPVETLYGVNMFGAVAGAAATGFLLLPSLGLQKTIYLGCLLNFAVCTAGLVLFQRARDGRFAGGLWVLRTCGAGLRDRLDSGAFPDDRVLCLRVQPDADCVHPRSGGRKRGLRAIRRPRP